MNNTPSTSSAVMDRQFVDQALETSRMLALEEAGKQELAVSDVKDLQRMQLQELLYGDAMQGEGTDQSLPLEMDQALKDDDAARMTSLGDAQDAYVFERTDATAGVQDDSDRSIGIAHDVMADSEMTKRVATHEAEHAEQETGNAIGAIPETGDAVIDADNGTIDRLTFRERGAIDAEGGLHNHTPEYHGYVERSEAVAQYLNDAGINGDELVKAAGKTNEGFRRLQGAIIMASARKRLEEAGVTSAALTA